MNYEKVLKLAVTIAVIVAITIITLGTLAIPVVMSIMFSWYWMFLYAGYMLIALFVAVYSVNNNSTTKGVRSRENR